MTFERDLYDEAYWRGLHPHHWFKNPPRKYEERDRDVLRVVAPRPTDVDPDVLLVDEALSVGDEGFKVRCQERMQGFRERGKTFLLVSHSLADVVETCQRAVWIHDGTIAKDGPAAEVCRAYHDWSVGQRQEPAGS